MSRAFLALSIDDVGYDSCSSIASNSPPSSPLFQQNNLFFYYFYDPAFQPVTIYYDVPVIVSYDSPAVEHVQQQQPPVEYRHEERVVTKSFRTNRQIKWNLPPPIIPDFELPGWEMMP